MSNRMKKGTAINLNYTRIPQIFLVETSKYYDMGLEAKFLYGLFWERSNLSLKNGWFNDNDEVYFVFPIEKICAKMKKSNKTIVKAKKELIEYGLLEEERTGRANKMYILEPIADSKDIKKLFEEENDLDFGKEILEKNEDGTTRSVNNSLQENTRSEENTFQADSRNEEITLQENSTNEQFTFQVETALNQLSDQKCKNGTSGENQKCNIYKSEVNNLHTSNIDFSNEEEDNNINKKESVGQEKSNQESHNESIQNPELKQSQQAIYDTLASTKLFTSQETQSILQELIYLSVNLETVNEQLDSMRNVAMIFEPSAYFMRGIRKRLTQKEFQSQKSTKVKTLPKIPMHNWAEGV